MPLVVFTCLSFVLSWSYWLWLLSQGLRVAPGSGVSHLPGLMGPAIAALVTVALFEGRAGLVRLLAGLIGRPRGGLFLLAVMVAPPLLSLGTVAVRGLLSGSLPALADFTDYPGLLPAWSGPFGLLAVLVLNGLGEELGWRGFALDRLVEKQGRVRGILLLTAIWAIWHLPLFWLNSSMAALVGPMLIGWLFSLACGAFVLADLYWRSGRRLWTVILWHVLYNAVVATTATQGLPAAVASAFVVVWGIDAFRRFGLADKAERKRLRPAS
jgi:membrane protease YdiL (CAAX protease family)